MSQPRALDLFAGAGGASYGLALAGYEVTGVDINPQPRYPFPERFIQADALTVDLGGYDLIWASPPCQAFSSLKAMWNAKEHPDLIDPIRQRLVASGVHYIIENVPGAPLRHAAILCGTMFGLGTGDAELRRHRQFETSFPVLTPGCQHRKQPRVIGIYGGHGRDRRRTIGVYGNSGGTSRRDGLAANCFTQDERREAMGIDWMTGASLSQAIPPAYSRFLGEAALRVRAAA